MQIFIAALLFMSLFTGIQGIYYYRRGTTARAVAEAYVNSFTGSDKFKKFYAKKQQYLIQTGADYYVKKNITVEQWYMYKIITGVGIGFIVGLAYTLFTKKAGILPGVLVGLVGYFFWDFIVTVSNRSENDKMLPDIAEMSRSIMYGVKGSQNIIDAFCDAVMVVENKRLKTALIRAKNNIERGASLNEVLEDFEFSFINSDIQALCAVIRSLQSTGQIEDALKTMETNVDRTQSTVDKKRAQSLRDRTMLYVMLIAFDLLIIMMFAVGVKIFSLVNEF